MAIPVKCDNYSDSNFDNMIEEDNKTIWCGNLAEQVTEELLYELFLQVCIFAKASSNVR